MARKAVKKLKLQIPGGAATPAGSVGPALGQAGVNIGEFVTKFNEVTKDRKGEIVPTVITVYDDRTFEFVLKAPPVSNLLLKAIGKEKGSGKNALSKVGSVSQAQLREIAERKMQDLNANDVEAAMKIVAGTARSMGIEVK